MEGAEETAMQAMLKVLPQLQQLQLKPQLPPAVLGQLPSQLEELQLAHPACDAVQLSQQTQALQRLRSLTLMYSVPRLGRQHVLRHAPAWASIAALRCLHLQLHGESCELCPALAAAVAGATALKQLTAVFPNGVAHDVDVVAMLSPLRQLEGLELRLATVAPVETLQGLLSQQLTRLQSLTLELVPLRQLVLSQVCLQAMQLTQLVLARADMSGDRLDMLAYSMVQLRRLALCYCNLSAGDVLCSGVVRAVSPPRLPSLQQLAVVEVGCSAEAVVGIKQGVAAQRPSLAVAVVTDTRYLPSGFVGKEPDSDRPGLVYVEH
uniref:F-box domain-containing protein n=1 Tax=Tetradesmus obliquus TaxID=3088 RepID=A0A383VW03_TETOB|eukprot:jgi/Sobl393_1/8210/SZX69391.1